VTRRCVWSRNLVERGHSPRWAAEPEKIVSIGTLLTARQIAAGRYLAPHHRIRDVPVFSAPIPHITSWPRSYTFFQHIIHYQPFYTKHMLPAAINHTWQKTYV
jgi:hypothetical protein